MKELTPESAAHLEALLDRTAQDRDHHYHGFPIDLVKGKDLAKVKADLSRAWADALAPQKKSRTQGTILDVYLDEEEDLVIVYSDKAVPNEWPLK